MRLGLEDLTISPNDVNSYVEVWNSKKPVWIDDVSQEVVSSEVILIQKRNSKVLALSEVMLV